MKAEEYIKRDIEGHRKGSPLYFRIHNWLNPKCKRCALDNQFLKELKGATE